MSRSMSQGGPGRSEAIELSVVVPVFNEAKILDELVTRCLRASREADARFELVLVDDGSTDDTPQVLAALASDASLRVVRLARNAGQFRATQEGLRQARGALVAVLDGDTHEALSDRILEQEHGLYVAAVKKLAAGGIESDSKNP